MKIRFWGVRGSIAVPGPSTVRFGGNTACVSIETPDVVVVLDAGTGIKDLGLALKGDSRPIVVLTTHCHWDHWIGFPYFLPLWEADREIHVVATTEDGKSPLDLLDGEHFPKHHTDLPASCRLVSEDGTALLLNWGLRLERQRLNHPGGNWGFRIGAGSKSLTYITDNELDSTEDGATLFGEVAEFARGTDILCHDAQFAPEEMADHCGWGHSDVDRVCELARVAGARHLILFHHDPMRNDDQIDDIQASAKANLARHEIECTAAWEGLELEL